MANASNDCHHVNSGGDILKESRIIASLDIGTSNIRCHIYDKEAELVGKSTTPIKIIYPEERGVELDPDVLWEQILDVMRASFKKAGVQASEIAALGIAVQRGTFLLWDSESGKPLHNFVVWQDNRGEHIERNWNESYTMKVIRASSKFAHGVTRRKRFMAASVINFRTNHVTIRLLWVFEKFPEIKRLAEQGKVRFGTLETWLIWKLTSGKVYVSEISCASSTGIYDPYIREWNSLFGVLMSIPMSIFPPVADTNYDFGTCHPDIFGSGIPIRAVMGDQQSAMFGQCCNKPGDVKLTIGTGAFMDINVGLKPHTSVEGFYPVTGWKRGSEIIHLAEGSCHTAGEAVEWLISLLSIESPEMTESIAESVENCNGVFFVPAFSGLQAPSNDFSACGSLIGLKASTTKAHITRAVLEALAFKNAEVYKSMMSEISWKVNKIVCDGGVTANNFVMQLTADLIGEKIQRMKKTDMSALGVAFMAGLAINFWKSDKELSDLNQLDTVFIPDRERAEKYKSVIQQWRKAVERSKRWYDKN